MKKLMYLAAAAVVGLFASCSSDSVTDEAAGAAQLFDNGKGYVDICVATPTTKGMGLRYNGDFNDGEKKEYAVEDILLVIFSGATDDENAAVIRSAYNLSDQRDKFQLNGNTDQITSSANIVAEIQSQNIAEGDKLFAFIILNDHQFFEVEKEGNLIKNAAGENLIGKTFAEFQNELLNETGRDFSANSFFMTNVPVSSVAGGTAAPSGAKVTTLVPFTYDKIYNTRQEALDGDASFTVNVERALAKVTVDWDGANGKLVNDATVEYEVLGWILDNTNKYTYVTRHMTTTDLNVHSARYAAGDYYSVIGDNNLYRMVDKNYITPGQFRTYWAYDMNYDEDVDPTKAAESDYPFVTRALELPTDLSDFRANKSTYYCTENTFDVPRQTEKNTTRIVLAAKFNEGKDFWTLAQNGTTMYQDDPTAADEHSIQAYIYSTIGGRVNMENFMSKYVAAGKTVKDIFNIELTTDAHNVGTVAITLKAYSAGNFKAGVSETDVQTAWGNPATAGTMAYRFTEYINNEFNYYKYSGGLAYYTALIKHFGDYETPWKRAWLGEGFVNNNTIGVYENNNADNYLGRYGIVRNNWYDIKVNGIREIGSNTIPSLPDTPDDPVRNFLNVEINITPWAMRTQSVIL